MSTLRYWPDCLPRASVPYELEPVDASIRTEMSVGAARKRRRTFARQDMVECAFVFTKCEMEAFDRWYYGDFVSLCGNSDDVSAFDAVAVQHESSTVVGPSGALGSTVIETTEGSRHGLEMDLPDLSAGTPVWVCATLSANGRSKAQIRLRDLGGTLRSADVDLSTGLITDTSGVDYAETVDRGDGWWRVIIIVTPWGSTTTARVQISTLQETGGTWFVGDGVSGINICEVNVQYENDGLNAYLPTDDDGCVRGAATGTAWVQMDLPRGGTLRPVEARFTAPFKAKVQAGMHWQITAQLETRDA